RLSQPHQAQSPAAGPDRDRPRVGHGRGVARRGRPGPRPARDRARGGRDGGPPPAHRAGARRPHAPHGPPRPTRPGGGAPGRPFPAGRLQPQEVLWFGLGPSLAGTVYLAVTLTLLTSLVGLAALLSYLLLYTPLKRRSGLCTLVGACPGAAPVLMGWAAVRG